MGSRVEMLKHWYRLSRGGSYWTSSPRAETAYRGGTLDYYYRDYSGKTRWEGRVDARGMPLVREAKGPPFCHPLILAQKALGHWNLRARHGDATHRESFLRIAGYLRDSQGTDGGWTVESMKKTCYVSPYSTLVQAQVASVLVRAAALLGEESFLHAAHRGLLFMLKPVEAGGTACFDGADLYLEEYPLTGGACVVLNGWISALFGLYDYVVAAHAADLANALDKSLATLSRRAGDYDAGYWSYYDRLGAIASPYYHRVHIAQMGALARAFPVHASTFTALEGRFEGYLGSARSRTRAVGLKIAQKLRTPPVTVLAQTRDRGGRTRGGTV